MVAEPYVNHIPTMTGGVGFDKLRDFYANHFVGVNPPDFELVPVSRTVGESSVVDELVARFTHTTYIDWMPPGIEPTGRTVEIPLVAIVKFEGDKLVHEHIYWTKPACSCSWACSKPVLPGDCPSPAPKPRTRCSIPPCQATH
ncbi:nuclear transport factor 2 family protein [Mycolicibacterium moriokaense]|nr:nuclear transport factor 2 family protein [Mycolicibacterium moriokaense]